MTYTVLESMNSLLIVFIISYLLWIGKREALHAQKRWSYLPYLNIGLILILLFSTANIIFNFTALNKYYIFNQITNSEDFQNLIALISGYILLIIGCIYNLRLTRVFTQEKQVLESNYQLIEKQFHSCKIEVHELNNKLQQQIAENKEIIKELTDTKEKYGLLLDTLPIPINYEGQQAFISGLTDVTAFNKTQYINTLLTTAVECAGESIEIVDSQARIEYVNPAFEKITGYSRAEVIGKTPASIMRSDKHNQAFYEDIWNTISSGKVWKGCITSKRKDRSLCYQEVTFSPVCNSDNTITHYIGVRRDITERRQAEEEKQKFVSLVENSSDFIAISSLEGELIYLNEAGRKLVGLNSLKEAISISIQEYFPEDIFADYCEVVLPKVMALGRWESESKLRHFKTGELIDVQKSCFLVKHPETNEALCLATVQRDITERKKQEERLRLLERAITSSNNGIVITDAEQPDNPIVYVNPGFEEMTGYKAEDVIGKNCRFLQKNAADKAALDELRTAIKEGKDCSIILRNYRKDGTLFWNELRISPVCNSEERLTHFIGIQTDITDRKVAEEQLIHNAFHDALTGLPNRALFVDRLGRAIARSKRRKDYLFAVLFLDLDGFKMVNDGLGHLAGDRLLIEFARRLEKCLRIEDTVARLGGDEFTILLDSINDINDATVVADRIHQALALPFYLDEHEVLVSSSIGIVPSSIGYDWSGDLLRDADTAMYRAKVQGKAQHIVFDQDMHNCVLARLQMEIDLRRAFERQEFIIYYQPIVSLFTGKITGFEALVRWQHPEKGLISPSDFIPVAEETGLIIPIDYWVLTESCRQMSNWHKQFSGTRPLTISVNLSSKEFSQPNIVKRIDQILEETNLEPSNLKLEITERVILKNTDSVRQTLLQLRERNIELCIDDFGTGYSALSYLHSFPINMLKIDRSFISTIGANSKNLQIVQTIIALAHQLKIDVTAEGIEKPEQLIRLRKLKCQYGQGFLFPKPMDSKAAENLIIANNLNKTNYFSI